MELTDKLYEQIARYVNNEMDAAERALFERQVKQNEEIAREVKLYREIGSVCESADKKIKDLLHTEEEEKKISEDRIREMITQARKEWEDKNEEALLSTLQQKFITKQNHTKLRSRKPVMLQPWSLLAAALVIGIICFGVVWYLKNNPSTSKITADKPPDQKIVTKEDTIINQPVVVINDSSQKNQLPPANDHKEQNLKKLFATSFKPDAAPQEREEWIHEPFDFYEAKKFDDAIETFEMAKAALDTRGTKVEKENTRFYIHYYLALSYLSANKGWGKAIVELKEAVKSTNDNILIAKAQWYLALAYLRNGDVTSAEKILDPLQKNNKAGHYRQQAINLSEELNRPR